MEEFKYLSEEEYKALSKEEKTAYTKAKKTYEASLPASNGDGSDKGAGTPAPPDDDKTVENKVKEALKETLKVRKFRVLNYAGVDYRDSNGKARHADRGSVIEATEVLISKENVEEILDENIEEVNLPS